MMALIRLIFIFKVIWCTLLSILVPILIVSTIQKRPSKVNTIRYILDIFTGIIKPIQLHYELVANRIIKKKLLLMDNVKMAPNFNEVIMRIRFLEEQLIRHSRLQVGLETIFQVTGNAILLLFAHSKTRSRQGLSLLFQTETDIISGISLPSEILLAFLLLLNLLSFVKVQMNGIIEGFASNYSFPGKALILLGVICAALVRISSMTLYFSTNLGLFDLLHHYQGRNIKLNNKSIAKCFNLLSLPSRNVVFSRSSSLLQCNKCGTTYTSSYKYFSVTTPTRKTIGNCYSDTFRTSI